MSVLKQISLQDVQMAEMFLNQTENTVETLKKYSKTIEEFELLQGEYKLDVNNDAIVNMKKKLEYQNLVVGQSVGAYVKTCSHVFKDNDDTSVKLGIVKVMEYDEIIENHPLLKEYILPFINNMKLGLKNRACKVNFVACPEIKNLTSEIASNAIAHYTMSHHQINNMKKDVANVYIDYAKKHDEIIKYGQKKFFSKIRKKHHNTKFV